MRPRLFAAENVAAVSGVAPEQPASMRPRLFAAENRSKMVFDIKACHVLQ